MIAHGENEDFIDGDYVLATNIENVVDEVLLFKNELYRGRLRDIELYLSTLKRQEGWMDKAFKDIRHQSYGYLLRDGFLWKRAKWVDELPLRVVDDSEIKTQVLKEFHDALWVGYREVWATYTKIKERYWWKGLYKDVEEFVASCITCQLQSKIRCKNELHPTYPPSIHFQ